MSEPRPHTLTLTTDELALAVDALSIGGAHLIDDAKDWAESEEELEETIAEGRAMLALAARLLEQVSPEEVRGLLSKSLLDSED